MKTWIIKLEVSDTWVADGFEFGERAAESLAEVLVPEAREGEVRVTVLDKPETHDIRVTQGFQSPDSKVRVNGYGYTIEGDDL